MPGRIDARLTELDIVLPTPQRAVVAKILPYTITGNLLFISGQVPRWEEDVRYKGTIGKDLTVEEGQQAARLCALNVLTHARAALDGDLDRIEQFVKVNGFAVCTDDIEVAHIVNGASELFIDVFGDAGKHARIAIGVARMPLGVSIEVEAIMQIST